MKLDLKGINFLKSLEGPLGLKGFLDQGGVCTIGWGHTYNARSWMHITPEEAQLLLTSDLLWAEASVAHFVTVELNDHEYAAIVSFVFNEGVDALEKSTLLKKLNAGLKTEAADEFDKWVHYHDKATGQIKISAGLTSRRAREKKVFLQGFFN